MLVTTVCRDFFYNLFKYKPRLSTQVHRNVGVQCVGFLVTIINESMSIVIMVTKKLQHLFGTLTGLYPDNLPAFWLSACMDIVCKTYDLGGV